MILFRVLLCISVVKQLLFKRDRKAGRSPEGQALGSSWHSFDITKWHEVNKKIHEIKFENIIHSLRIQQWRNR
jgi:hypothetical protein